LIHKFVDLCLHNVSYEYNYTEPYVTPDRTHRISLNVTSLLFDNEDKCNFTGLK